MPVLGLGRSERDTASRYDSRLDEVLLDGDSYVSTKTAAANVSFEELNRRTCASLECAGGLGPPMAESSAPGV